MNHPGQLLARPFGRGALALVGVVLLLASDAGAAVYLVSSSADAGPGSLRQAILDANAHAGIDEIRFALGANKTIKPLSPLPAITGTTDLNGTSQPGYAGVPLVEIDGASAGQAAGLTVSSALSKIRGLVINRFAGDGIRIEASAVLVTGCRIGTDKSGSVARGNGGAGIRISGGLNVIGGLSGSERNLVSGNAGTGIEIVSGSRSARVVKHMSVVRSIAQRVALPERGFTQSFAGRAERHAQCVERVTADYRRACGASVTRATLHGTDAMTLRCAGGADAPEGVLRRVIRSTQKGHLTLPTPGKPAVRSRRSSGRTLASAIRGADGQGRRQARRRRQIR